MPTGKPIVFANSIKSFHTHPEFGKYTGGMKDPGKLKFNHKLHLQAGQVPSDGVGGYTLGKIKTLDPAAYERFKDAAWQKDKADTAAVQLDCASCHVPTKPVEKDAVAGRYMQPIKYDAHGCVTLNGTDVSVPCGASPWSS